MKKIIKLTENQLKDIITKVIKEQVVPIGNPNTFTTPFNSSSQERISNIAKTLTANNGVLPRDYIVKYDINPIELQAAKSLIGQQQTTQYTQNQRNKNIINAINSIDPQTLLIKSSNPKLNGMTWKQYRDTYKITDVDITNAKSYLSKTDPVGDTKLDSVEKSSKSNQNCAPQLIDTSKGKILKFGCKTQGVKELQTLLDFTTPTGYFGNITKKKVMDFQKNNNLKVDSIVGPETYKVLIAKAVAPPSQDVSEQGTTNSNLTVPEQTLLGFLNRFLKGEEGEFQNTPIELLKSNMLFNSKTIYPMTQKLLEKKRTGKKTYDDKTFNALFLSMDKAITKEQRYQFFKDAANITNITYNSQY